MLLLSDSNLAISKFASIHFKKVLESIKHRKCCVLLKFSFDENFFDAFKRTFRWWLTIPCWVNQAKKEIAKIYIHSRFQLYRAFRFFVTIDFFSTFLDPAFIATFSTRFSYNCKIHKKQIHQTNRFQVRFLTKFKTWEL